MNSQRDEAFVFTIGYGARKTDEFLGVLRANDVAFVIDIRTRPYSRFRPEFSRGALGRYLEAAGVRYVYMGDTLGGQPSDSNLYMDGKVDYTRVARSELFQKGMARICTAHEKRIRVALMCSEGKPEACHRSKLIGRALDAEGVPVRHIDEADRVVGQEEVLLRLTGGTPHLFGEVLTFTSRKAYLTEDEDER